MIVPVSNNFARGYISDIPRDQLPPDAAYRMKDWIPGLDARLHRRGGWTYSTQDLSGLAAIGQIQELAWVPYPGDEHLMMISENGAVFLDRDFDGSHAALVSPVGSVFNPLPPYSQPFWNKNLQAMILLQNDTTPYKYYTTGGGTWTTALLGGTPPRAGVGCSWKDYILLAVGNVGGVLPEYGNRIWVSGVGDPESWTPGTDFWDSEIPTIVSLVPIRGGILVFGYENISLITGDIPPAGGNWSEGIIFHDNGAFDSRSVVTYRDYVVFANTTGVYMTDGVTLKDVTAVCGVKLRWQELLQPFYEIGSASYRVAAGIFRDKYIIKISDPSNNLVTCHVFDLALNVAYEFTNFPFANGMFAHRVLNQGAFNFVADSGQEMLFLGGNLPRVMAIHPIWTSPDAGTDANGTAILPQLETGFYKPGGPGKKLFRSSRFTYDVRGGANPTLSVDYCVTPGGAYTSAGSLPTTTDEDRQRADIRTRSLGIGLRVTQVGQSSHTTLNEIELDVNVLEPMR